MLDRVRLRLRALLRKNKVEADLDDELWYHLQKDIERNIARGMEPRAARSAALRAFGGVQQIKEASRDARGVEFAENLWRDLRYGAWMLRKHPGFTLTVVITLALGIGANTAVFNIVDAYLLRLLPVKDPQQLVFVHRVSPEEDRDDFLYPTFEQFRENTSFSGMFASDVTHVSVTVDGQPEMLWGNFVSGDYFDLLGVEAVLGRAFNLDDDKGGERPVAVINYGYWQRRFGRDRSVVGRTIYVGRIPFTIVGVTSPRFVGLNVAGRSPDLIMPMFMHHQLALGDHDRFEVMARLRPGVTAEQARADLDLIYQHSLARQAVPGTSGEGAAEARDQRIELKPGLRGHSMLGPNDRLEVRILFAIVGIVLLIAAVNVANLLLARGSARQMEVAVRLAMGAGRRRLIRQLLTESLLLASLSGAAGWFFARWGLGLLLSLLSFGSDSLPPDLPSDLRILLFTAGVSILTGVVFGLAPAVAATRVNLNPILKEGSDRSRPLRGRVGKLLVVTQVALSLALLIGAGLLIRSLRGLREVDLGFERDRVLTMSAYPILIGYDPPKEMALYRASLEKISAIPGVQAASLSRYAVGRGSGPIGPRFFETMGIVVIEGREFTDDDNQQSTKVAIINESMARKAFPDQDPVGRSLPRELLGLNELQNGAAIQVVGVVGDIRRSLWRSGSGPAFYIPYTQAPPRMLGQINFLVRTAPGPASVIPAIREAVQSVDRDLPLVDIQTLADQIYEGSLSDEQSLARFLGLFGGLAMLMAAIGLSGTMSYAVGRRTRELGIRMALGAEGHRVLRMVLGETLSLFAVGTAIGILLSLGASRLISSLLFGVTATDPVSIAAAVLVMFATAFVAGYVPARRASKIDPTVALRYE